MLENGKQDPINIMFGTGASSAKTFDELYPLIQTVIKCGIFAFDSAPSYRTETVLGLCLNRCMTDFSIKRENLFIQTKIDAWQMAEGRSAVETYIQNVIRDMGVDYLDALAIHWPVPEYMEQTWKTFVKAKESGCVRYIGICNLRMRQLYKLPLCGVMPDFIQIERHPLRTCKKEVEYCHDKGIEIQAYSPLCKMHKKIAESPALQCIAEKYGRNIGQVVLRWQIDSGVVPIFTSRKIHRIQEYASLNDFSLKPDEMESVDSLNQNYKMYLESFACPGY